MSKFVSNPSAIVGDGLTVNGNLGTKSGAKWGSGDFNGDGDVDVSQIETVPGVGVRQFGDSGIFLANRGRTVAGSIASMRSTNPQQFVHQSQYPIIGDFAGDGRQALLAIDASNNNLASETWTVSTISEAGAWPVERLGNTSVVGAPERFVAGDFNGDGRDDLIATFAGGDQWYFVESALTNDPSQPVAKWIVHDGDTNRGIDNPGWSKWSDLVAGDFNGDGRDDIAGYNFASSTIEVAYSRGLRFDEPITAVELAIVFGDDKVKTAVAVNFGETIVADFNGDSRDDLWLAQTGSSTRYAAISDGYRFNVFAANQTEAEWQEPLVGDFDGDGDQELIGQTSNSAEWNVFDFDEVSGQFSSEPAGFFSSAAWSTAETPLHRRWTITVGDANGDGRDDLVGRGFGTETSTASRTHVALGQSDGWLGSGQVWTTYFASGANSAVVSGTNVIADVDARYQEMVDIYSNVYNNIELELYAGLMKGPQATEETKAGNPWDQAALLVRDLEEAGFTADLVHGQVDVEYSKLKDWLGVTSNAAAFNVVRAAFDANATPFATGVKFKHAWIVVTFANRGKPGHSHQEEIFLDPSWKFKDRQQGVAIDLDDFVAATPSVPVTPTASAIAGRDTRGVFDEFEYLAHADRNELPVEWFETQVMKYLVDEHLEQGGKSLADVAYDGPIVQRAFDVLPGVTRGEALAGMVVEGLEFEVESGVFDNY